VSITLDNQEETQQQQQQDALTYMPASSSARFPRVQEPTASSHACTPVVVAVASTQDRMLPTGRRGMDDPHISTHSRSGRRGASAAPSVDVYPVAAPGQRSLPNAAVSKSHLHAKPHRNACRSLVRVAGGKWAHQQAHSSAFLPSILDPRCTRHPVIPAAQIVAIGTRGFTQPIHRGLHSPRASFQHLSTLQHQDTRLLPIQPATTKRSRAHFQ